MYDPLRYITLEHGFLLKLLFTPSSLSSDTLLFSYLLELQTSTHHRSLGFLLSRTPIVSVFPPHLFKIPNFQLRFSSPRSLIHELVHY
ncbi:hypothetical protein L1887_02185 [Cichorium endivia]|nr:hypothetical protein L1887_02185 [Cichorium endivia]